MIALQSDCLLFQLANGESVPCSAEMISFDITGTSCGLLDPETLRHAAASVFHYFKEELGAKPSPSANSPSRWKKSCAASASSSAPAASNRIRRARARPTSAGSRANPPTAWSCSFSRACAANSAPSSGQSPRVVRFRGLRGCVKQLAGARRWSHRCERLQDQIVEYLRGCLTAEPEQNECALVVE